MVCVKAVALYGSELWWEPREVGRRERLQLLLNRQGRSMLGVQPATLRGALTRESGVTPRPVTLDYRQQRFAALLENTCSSMLKEQHRNPSSGALLWSIVLKEHGHGRTTDGMTWAAMGENPAVRNTILDDTTAAKSPMQRRAREKEAIIGAGI